MNGSSSGGGIQAAADEASADFLRRLSVADAKVLLERTRKEKDAKIKEMQKMIGVRYRDLIESADKIVTMHSAAMRLETTLREMPDQWKQMESRLASSLAISAIPPSPEIEAGGGGDGQSNSTSVATTAALTETATMADRVLFLVSTHEQLWGFLDQGETYQALKLFHKAQSVYDASDLQLASTRYPFLPSFWASVQGFHQRMISTAKTCLTCRGKSSRFYADNLLVLAELEETSSCRDLLAQFLDSRSKWLEFDDGNEFGKSGGHGTGSAPQRRMRVNLRALVLTVLDAQAIFCADLGSARATGCDTFHTQFMKGRNNVTATVDATPAIMTQIGQWFNEQRQRVCRHAVSMIDNITTIACIAQVQAKLTNIDKQYAGYLETPLWKNMSSNSHAGTPNRSMFELLFGAAFRKRTRDLVQSSFVHAMDAIKDEVRICLHSPTDEENHSQHLKGIRFYEFFDSIHDKVAGLDSRELQRVLTEEYVRSLFNFIVFLESEFVVAPANIHANGNAYMIRNPSIFFSLSNLLTLIVSEFPSRVRSLFGEQGSDAVFILPDAATARSHDIFQRYALDGQLTKESLQLALKNVEAADRDSSSFLDEDIKAIESVGFFSFFLASSVKLGESYPRIFVSMLSGLASECCKSWARHQLEKNIAPLREVLRAEHYKQTNEEWISSHQGWSEHTIIDEATFSDEDDPLESGDMNTRVNISEEKVWLPWCETPRVSSFLFSCCYALDEAYRLVRNTSDASSLHVTTMQKLIRQVLIEQVTLVSVEVYDEAVTKVVEAKAKQSHTVLNFGECYMLQFLFDMYFVRATLGFSDFIRFGWGDEIDPATASPSLARLKNLFDRMHDFVDPVDWEIYGLQLIENVVIQFRKSRLLFSSLSEASDISVINGKKITVSAQDTRPIVCVVEPVPRFSLLPVPITRRRHHSEADSTVNGGARSPSVSTESLFQERNSSNSAYQGAQSLKFQDILAGSAGSNILSAATSGSTNLLSSAAKGMSFLSSATSSYLREGDGRNKYF